MFQNHDPGFDEQNICKGRIVYLHEPETGSGCIAGMAVIDSGDNAGQRVEFERQNCHAFGFALKNTDLSLIFHFGKINDNFIDAHRIMTSIFFIGDEVFIQVKPYNSYCVEKLWVGFTETSLGERGLLPQYDRHMMKKYLYDHGLDMQGFDAMVRGQVTTRPFLPLKGQTLRGKIKMLKCEVDGGPTDKIVIEASDLGDILYVEADRERCYLYGRHLAKADLAYLFEKGSYY